MFSDYKIRAGQAMIEKRTLNDTFRCGKCFPEVDNLICLICCGQTGSWSWDKYLCCLSTTVWATQRVFLVTVMFTICIHKWWNLLVSTMITITWVWQDIYWTWVQRKVNHFFQFAVRWRNCSEALCSRYYTTYNNFVILNTNFFH